jgi:hypothetical protein
MRLTQGWIWAGALAAVFLVPLGTVLVVNRSFTEYSERATTWEPSGVSDDGRTVTVEYVMCEGSLQSLDHVERTETPSTVTLTIVVRESSRGDCEDVAAYHTTEVELAAPLGNRQLIDGRTGSEPEFFSQPPRSR